MKAYLTLLQKILDYGEVREDRTGTGTLGLFGEQIKVDLADGFPLLTTKKMPFKSVVAELLWFLRGETTVESLRADGCTIWDEWATKEQCARFGREEGDLGPIYGWQFRRFGAPYPQQIEQPTPNLREGLDRTYLGVGNGAGKVGFDQIRWLVDEIKKNPFSRRLVVSAWNPADAAVVALPPCHTLFQCCVQGPSPTFFPSMRRLSLHLYMRSADYFLGVPFNVASYALLTHMLARECTLAPGVLTVSFGDVHLYRNHVEQAREQLSRDPKRCPSLALSMEYGASLFNVRREDVGLVDYHPHPAIKAEVSV